MSRNLIQQRFEQIRDRSIAVEAKRDLLRSQLQETQSRIDDKYKLLEIREMALEVLKKLIDEFYEKNIRKVEKIISFGLQEVFPDRLLRIRTEVTNRRGKTNLDVITVDEEIGVEGRADRSFGGAVVQVQSFLMLATFIVLLRLKPICFLDEQFSNVSANYQGNVGKMISKLCKKLKLSVCLVTHNAEILDHADKVYMARMVGGELKLELKK